MQHSAFYLLFIMLTIRLICTGKLKEKFYISAMDEYSKRLSTLCRFECIELAEQRLPDSPSEKNISDALQKEALEIRKNIPSDAYVICMCVEGKQISSESFSTLIAQQALAGKSKICFIIGSSYGLASELKKQADFKLSLSPMTFPHHLARVILAEQIYRAFKIQEGSRYHK